MDKKLQVFVSSTYLDLIDERQKAVEGILRSGHIPAGMELFIPNNKTQWEIIEKWIKESDVLMLILGGKYGTVEKKSGKSYTQLEYEFALANNIPVFAVVLNEQYLANKKSKNIDLKVNEYEEENPNVDKYKSFKNVVTSNLVSFVHDINQISNEVTLALQNFMKNDEIEYHFKGWVRGTELNKNTPVEQSSQGNKLFDMDEILLNEVIDKLESEYFIDTIDYIANYCTYELESTNKIYDFIYTYSKPTKRFFNEELQNLFTELINKLNKYTNYLGVNFFRKNDGLYLYPELNIDYQYVDEEGRKTYEMHLNRLSEISSNTIGDIRNFVHASRITLYK
ncbi:DUF4062 domain-containing protein [Paraliobacillus zengyii]|uniref:DUF4062 domain-containing protein n=1 Tax=Paraliobacillus zengyii TaxID=2213194 RepID=UPI000DD4DC42|nr:DUF4062 domain-containing protein [Paraliobacillus zengyii]